MTLIVSGLGRERTEHFWPPSVSEKPQLYFSEPIFTWVALPDTELSLSMAPSLGGKEVMLGIPLSCPQEQRIWLLSL